MRALMAFAAVTSLAACTKRTAEAPTPKAVAANYADLVYANYAEALATTRALQSAVHRFLEAPSAARQEIAKRAWLEARTVYGQTEAFRFYGGPIDDETGPEGRINGWPLDESYIDYVDTQPAAGIVNKPEIEITTEKLSSMNEGAAGDVLQRGEAFNKDKAIATGYHAIEFLLWGQDKESFGPGTRPWTDYAASGGAPNATRRGTYLKVVTDLLVDDLVKVEAAWAPNQDNYRKKFLAQDDATVLKAMLTGIGVLTKGELAGERIDVALDTLDQEDEHSCFSDNTKNDVLANATGIRNVYVGRYGLIAGPSLSDLVKAKDPALDGTLRGLLDKAVTQARSIPAPFDEAIKDKNGEGWKGANALVQTLFETGDKIVLAGKALDLGNISVALPE